MDDLARLGVQYRAEGHEQVKQANRDVAATGRDAKQAVDGLTRSQKEQAEIFTRLRASLDPAFAATVAYERSVRVAEAAVRSGAATQKEANHVLDLARQRYIAAGAAAKTAGSGFSSMGFGIQNAGYQIQDMAVQLEMGTNPMRVMSQQLPQLVSGFGGLGTRAALLASGFGAVLAVGSALAPVIYNMITDVKDAESAFDALDDAMASYVQSADLASRSVEELTKRYGENADAVRANFEAIAQLDALQAINALKDAVASIEVPLQKTVDLWQRYGDAAGRTGKVARDRMEDLAASLGLTVAEAATLAATFDALEGAGSLEDATAAAQGLQDMFIAIYGEASNIPPELQDAARQAIQAANAGYEIEAALGGAADEAGRIADNLDRARAGAAMMDRIRSNPDYFDPRGEGRGAANANYVPTPSGLPDVRLPRNPTSRSGRSGGGGGSPDRTRAAYDRLMGSLDPLIAAEQQYAQAQGVVNAALDAGTISAEEAAVAMAMLGEEHREALADIDGAPLQDMADSAKSLSENLLKAAAANRDVGDALRSWLLDQSIKLALSGMSNAFDSIFSKIGAGSGGGFLSSLGGLLLNANGNAFQGGNVIPFASGGVVDGPTLFPMANGAGLMGEAGPEAIMPLSRGADGKLGVNAGGGGNLGVAISFDGGGNLLAVVRDEAGKVLASQRASLRRDAVSATDRAMRKTGTFGGRRPQ